ncbi:substrate-binding domain-containing protein [Hydrogenophaga sp.]|jgi:urea transport system substrate-binding protein|uniref:substrate-binding domain-containing protein n=1 Tax=Hydrogenophaga sp. TaxID=1904254 RepID=UPI003F7031A3
MLSSPSITGSFAAPYQFGQRVKRGGQQRASAWRDGDRTFSVGLFVPMSGVAGIWGPSAIACATLASEEINRFGGLIGREISLKCFDASDEVEDISDMTREVVESGSIDVIVGMHTSSVRRSVIEGCRGRLPYIYTALHEGGEGSNGVFTLGETPERQLRPAIEMFVSERHARRWMFVGNDYQWPWISHRLARRYVHEAGGTVLSDTYVPFNVGDFSEILERIEREKPQAVLLSLVGQDAIDFNRAFGHAGLASRTLRLSCAIEENMLLAIGDRNTEDLFVCSGYFGALGDDANMGFKERYHQRFGQRAPTLNSLGQSTYEGVHFAAALAARASQRQGAGLIEYGGVRGIDWRGNANVTYPVHLAQVDGHFFHVVRTF